MCVLNLYCCGKNLKLMHVQSLWCSAALKLYPPHFWGFGSVLKARAVGSILLIKKVLHVMVVSSPTFTQCRDFL